MTCFPPLRRKKSNDYSAKDIEVLEGLEPVRRRPGMYIGGTDERAMHHLVAEVLDNAMDEAVAGQASRIEMELDEHGIVTVRDNGRGIPVDPHPKFKDKSALEVILTTLHSGGKFSGKVYQTSGGLHGVGLSVVNALADRLDVEVARDKQLYTQSYARGKPTGKLKKAGSVNRRGTTIRFHADPDSLRQGGALSAGAPLSHGALQGLSLPRRRNPLALHALADRQGRRYASRSGAAFPRRARRFPRRRPRRSPDSDRTTPFAGEATLPEKQGRLEWAIAWPADGEGFLNSYCNTIPTPEGGTHEAGLRSGLSRSLKAYGELIGNRKAAQITAEDICGGAVMMLSLFLREPQFQGQTKEKLANAEATRLVEATIKDHFDHWLSADKRRAGDLLERRHRTGRRASARASRTRS